MKIRRLVPLFWLALLGFPAKAFAHALATDYALEAANRLEIEAVFSTGEPFVRAKVVVYAPGDSSQPWMEGVTDEEGNFIFQPDRALEGDWRIEIGEYDHMDILSVPVNPQGIELENISRQVPQDETNPLMIAVGVAMVSGSLGTTLFLSRKKH